MKTCIPKIIMMMAVASLMFTGCSHGYRIKTTSGRTITSASKPKLENGRYVFKDAQGRKSYIPAGNVTEIAPASLSRDEKTIFKPTTSR